MIIADLHRGFEAQRAVTARGDRMPVEAIDFEFSAAQIVGISNDYPVGVGIEIHHIAWTRRTARQTFALANCEQLNPFVFGNKIPLHVVNLASMKFVFAEMRTQKAFVIIARHETNLLAVDFISDSESQ